MDVSNTDRDRQTDRVCVCCVIDSMYIDRYGLFVPLPYFHSPSPSLTRTQQPSLTNRSLIRSLFLSLLMHWFQLVRFFFKSVEIRIVFNNDPNWDFSRYKSKLQSPLTLYKIVPAVIAILISPGWSWNPTGFGLVGYPDPYFTDFMHL